MKSMNWAIALACVFISAVLFFLMFQGVKPKERRMIKWSKVTSVEKAGNKVASFFFPIINEYPSINTSGEGEFADRFFQSFSVRSQEISNKIKISKNHLELDPKFFTLEVKPMVNDDLAKKCKQGDSNSCVAMRAYRKFIKKERTTESYWISMYRVSLDRAVLYFVKPQ